MKHWTLDAIAWDRFDPVKVDADILRIIKAAAMVEHNGGDYAIYLNNVFAGDGEFRRAADDWALEEVQHGQALRRWAELNEYEVDSVFHLAAQTIVTIANRNPLSTFEASIKGTWNLLESSRRSPLVERIVVASSDKAYGSQGNLPYNEMTALEGKHPYDVSKSCADLLCGSYHQTYGLPVCITRCGNFYGKKT